MADTNTLNALEVADKLDHLASHLVSDRSAVQQAAELIRAQHTALAAPLPDAALADGWMPIETAPDGVRILLGPRHAPVVGMAYHKPRWAEDQERQVNVVHYNGTILVACYHCSEWRPLPAPPAINASGEGQL